MKKVLIISFLIFTILVSYFSTSYAAITVTEEALEQAFKNFIEYSKAEDSETNYSMNIDKENKQITLSTDDEDCIMDYDLSDKPTFKINLSFNNNMSADDFSKEGQKVSDGLITMLIMTADIAGISPENSIIYVFSSMFKNANSSELISFTSAVETAKKMYDKEPAFCDDLYTMTYKKISETENEYNVQAILEIDNTADFSIMNDSSLDDTMDQFSNTIMDSFQNMTQNMGESITNMVEQQEQVNKVTSSISKLPQTGDSFGLKDGLFLLCITASVALIYVVFKSVKYKKVEK